MDKISMWTLFSLVSLLCVIKAYDPSTCIQCRKSHVCNPPECFCCRDEMPLDAHSIPQMVFFTFDDAVNPAVAKHYQDLFDSKRLNPNGCPIRMTLFISHRNTVYSYVREFYEKGMEIASHSVTHSHPSSRTFLREAKKQKENLAKKANIPENKIIGWRSPFLEPLGDTQPEVLKQLGYEYDATLTITKKGNNDKAITPFTLDHGWPYDCKIKPCPANSHKGFWEVPVVSVKDYLNKYDCVYVDACHSPPPSESKAYQFLWDNFQRYYSTNRAPMGINMHASWFYYPDRKAAMDKFIKQLVKMDDVYIVTVKQVIDWLKTPTTLQNIKTFKPWLCNGNETTADMQTTNAALNKQPMAQNSQNQRWQQQNQQSRQMNNRQLQQQNQIRNNGLNMQPVVPQTAPFQTRQALPTPTWTPRNNMNSALTVPVPPMAPGFPAVRFWWRPPGMVNQQMQLELQRRQVMERQRQAQLQQQQLQQAQFQRTNRQEMLQRDVLEQQRQQMIQQKAQEEKLRQERLRQEEIKRQELLKQQKLEQQKIEEEKRQLRLKQEQLEKQKQEELKRQELLRQQQEKQKMKEKLLQEQLEKQKQEDLRRQELQRQKEEEKQQQELLRKQNQQRQELANKKQLENQRLEEQKRQEQMKQNQLENQKQNELKRQRITENSQTVSKGSSFVDNQSSHKTNTSSAFSKKLDEILKRPKQERIRLLQQFSLYELKLLQYEVRKRMKKGSDSSKTSKTDLTSLKNHVQQDIHTTTAVFTSMSQSPSVYTITTPSTSENIYQRSDVPTKGKYFDSDVVNLSPQPDIITIKPLVEVQKIIATEKPRTSFVQKTIPVQYDTTISPTSRNSFANNAQNTLDFSLNKRMSLFPVPETAEFKHQAVIQPSEREPTKPAPTSSVWQMDNFDIKNLEGPWKRASLIVPEPKIVTIKPIRKASLKLQPVSINLFNANNFMQSDPILPSRAFVRPGLFSLARANKVSIMPDGAVPIPYVSSPVSKDPQYIKTAQYSLKTTETKSPTTRSTTTASTTPVPTTTATTTTTTTTATTTTTTTPTTTTTTTPTTTTTTTPTTTTTTTPTTTTSTTTTTTTPTTTTTTATTTTAKTTSATTTARTAKAADIKKIHPVGQGRRQRNFFPAPAHWRLSGPAFVSSNISVASIGTKRPRFKPKLANGCQQGENCIVPECFCKTDSVPMGMTIKDVPQIVYITIDGSLNFHSLSKIRSLFSGRVNPNGCKIKGTMFITDAGSSYRIATLLVKHGVELAMMGMSSRPYSDKADLKLDVPLQRQRISDSANIPKESIKGWRSPGFRVLGDDQFRIMRNESLYDSSLVVDRSARNKRKLWPFTMDFGLKETCEVPTCPSRAHRGVWEVPVIPFLGPNNSTACEYIDACTRQPETAEQTFSYLMDNFNLYYKTNRAPFAIRLKQIWFHWYYREHLKGLFKFLDTILGYGDVYATSVSDMLEWMKSPTKVQSLNTFKPWACT